MKGPKILFLLIISSLFLSAETIELQLLDRDLQWPLEGVMVQIIGDSESYYSDVDGKILLERPAGSQRTVLLAQLPGYDSVRYSLKNGETEVIIEMVIAGVIEGKELVVERSAPGKSDEESGVSVVMEAEEMETTANVGIVEDVMSSVKTMPGVSYAGGWNAQPSIRGGDPQEMAALLDGIYVTYPYHWGGAFSIFNPNMTESAKLSHGVFSSKYGRALSGILEVNSKTPEEDFRADVIVSTSSTDLFLQFPMNDKMGLFLGGKITYLETVIYAAGMENKITTAPYIRDFYGKWDYRPLPNLNITVNGFLGTDGVGNDTEIEISDINTSLHFTYDYTSAFTTAIVEWAPNEANLLHFSGGYNYNHMNMGFEASYSGTRPYSPAFITAYDESDIDTDGIVGTINGNTGFSIDGLYMKGESKTLFHQLQGRLEWDHLINENSLITLGLDEIFLFTDYIEDFSGYSNEIVPNTYVPFNLSLETEGTRSLHSSLYSIWEFGSDHSLLQGEFGVRGEHYYLWNKEFSLNTYPVAEPRLQLRWTLLENQGNWNNMGLSLGSGLFAQLPLESSVIQKEWEIEDFEVGPNQAFYQIAGWNGEFLDNWKFQLEGYYKYFYNRLYITMDTGVADREIQIHQDGIGHAAGFDLMLQKNMSGKLDGYITYSFVYTRLMNPYEPLSETDGMINGSDPLNEWFYPGYHRYHSANLVLNYRPVPGWTLTTSASYASGTPMREVGEVTMSYDQFGTEYLESYSRTSTYSDSLRNEFSIPVDIRLSYTHYRRGSKWEEEWYIGVEDVLVNLYSPKGVTQFNRFTGKEQPGEADFNIDMPIPSIGYKASY